MAVERVFLGWNRPCLHEAAKWLMRRFAKRGQRDLSKVIVVVPAARAGRRLMELLTQQSARGIFSPPTIVTIGMLPEKLYEPEQTVATPLQSQLARARSLKNAKDGLLRAVVPHPPETDNVEAWFNLASEFGRITESLSAEKIAIGQAAESLEQNMQFADRDRWDALASLQDAYEQTLAEQNLVDRDTARRSATVECDQHVVLLATVDLPKLHREMLGHVENITALIHAPQEEENAFDEWGCLILDAWADRHLNLPEQMIHVVDRPRDQAHQLLQTMRSDIDQLDGKPTLNQRFALDEITVGLGDQDMAPALQRTLDLIGLPSRSAVGASVERSAPAMLLAQLARFLESQRRDDFAALLRHTDVESFLKTEQLPSRLDEYAAEHLQVDLANPWLDTKNTESLQKSCERLNQLIPDHATVQALSRWSAPIAEALLQVYDGCSLNRFEPDDTKLIRALSMITDVLRAQAELENTPDLAPNVTASQAIAITLSQLSGQTIPEEGSSSGGGGAIELLGWLELALDDAPAIIVTGLNEGLIPQSRTDDAFLPDHVRSALGLEDNRRRYARDLFILRAICANREKDGFVALISGRRNIDNEPLMPSRLVLSCDEEKLPKRVEHFYGDDEASHGAPLLLTKPGRDTFCDILIPPPDKQLGRTINRLSVTALRAYIADPYRFYLSHVLGLETIEDSASEMDGGQFGNVAHDVLKVFGRSDVRDSEDAEQIANFLSGHLDRVIAKQYGSSGGSVAIRLQAEQLRFRLDRFAQWQAAQVRDGWRILPDLVERKYEAPFSFDGETITLSGKIDRIDKHADGGYRVLDYKTGDAGKWPNETHRRSNEWIDLQLPLYKLLAELEFDYMKPVQLGYILLPKQQNQIGLAMANWDGNMIDRAFAKAREVVAAIREGKFWQPQRAPRWSDGLDRICLDRCIDRKRIIEHVSQSIEQSTHDRLAEAHSILEEQKTLFAGMEVLPTPADESEPHDNGDQMSLF